MNNLVIFDLFFLDANVLMGILFWQALISAVIIRSLVSPSNPYVQRNHVRGAVGSRVLFMLAYLLIFFRGQMPNSFSSSLGNVLFTSALYAESMVTLSLVKQLKPALSRYLTVAWLAMCTLYLAVDIFAALPNYRTAASGLAIIVIFAPAAYKTALRKSASRIERVQGGTMALVVLMAIPRVYVSLSQADFSVMTTMPVQSLLYLALLADSLVSALFFLPFVNAESDSALKRLANTDALTGLHNRRVFDLRAGEMFRQAYDAGTPLYVALIDVDDFKSVNDRHGHLMGDELLKKIASFVDNGVRLTDECCRFSGDVFAICLSTATLDNTYNVLQRILKEVNAIDLLPGRVITCSVGIAYGIPTAGLELADFINHADRAMYTAKLSGGGHIVARNLSSPQAPASKDVS